MPAVSSLLESLARLHLLDAGQLNELQRDPAAVVLDAKSLLKELVQRGWITPFQADIIQQGRGQELLLGSYVLVDKLGEGGMGAVYRARNWKLGRTVALKVVRGDRLNNPLALERFRREIRAAAQLSHPNVVHAIDAGEVGGVFFFAMELMAGADLSCVVKERGPLPVTQACDAIRQTALGLQHAHDRGLVHRDVKPSNLLLTPEGVVKVLDLGLARLNRRSETGENSATLTQQGALMGSLDYIAPEQARDSHTVDARADLYSLGCAFYFLLTGQPPFPAGLMGAKLAAHLFEEPEPVERLRRETPPAVAALIRKLMAKNPDDRCQTAGEVAAVLTAMMSKATEDDRTITELDARAGEAPAASTPPKGTAVASRRRSKGLLAGAIAVVLLAGLVGTLALVYSLQARSGPHARPQATDPPPPAPGELSLECDDASVRVLVHSRKEAAKNGVLRPGVPVPLTAGEYDLEPSPDELAGLRLSHATVTVQPGVRETVRVEGMPLSSWALVSRPARIEGVQSWTITTRTGRGAVDRLAYSPDGSRIAFATEDGVVRVVDAVQARQTGAHPPPTLLALVGHASGIAALAWSHDGRMLASAGYDRTVRVWDAVSGRALQTYSLNAQALAWSPDDGKGGTSQAVLACAIGNDVILRDTAPNTPEIALQKTGRNVRALAWSRQTGVLAAGDDSGAVVLWHREEGEWRSAFRKGHTKGVTSLAWSADGKRLVSGSYDGTVRVWGDDDLALLTVPLAVGRASAVAWSPDGKSIASGGNGDDHAVRLWDATSGAAGLVLPGNNYGVDGLSWSADGTLVSCGQDRYVRFWDPQTGKSLGVLAAHTDVVTSIAWSPDGSKVATGSQGTFAVWDASAGQRLRTPPGPGDWTHVHNQGWSADGRSVFTHTNGGRLIRMDLESLRSQVLLDDKTVWGQAPSPSGGVLAIWHQDGTIQLVDPDTGALQGTLTGRQKNLSAFAWSPDGSMLAAGDDAGLISLWAPPAVATVMEARQAARVSALTWSPDGQTLASAGKDGAIHLWDKSHAEALKSLKGSSDSVQGMAWTPDGKGLYTIGQDTILRLWDVAAGQVQQTLHPGTTGGYFSPDATRLVSGGNPWTVRLWETASGRPLGTAVLLNQGGVTLSADGHYRCENKKVENELVYIVQTAEGQKTLTPEEFAAKYEWQNDPDKARLDPR